MSLRRRSKTGYILCGLAFCSLVLIVQNTSQDIAFAADTVCDTLDTVTYAFPNQTGSDTQNCGGGSPVLCSSLSPEEQQSLQDQASENAKNNCVANLGSAPACPALSPPSTCPAECGSISWSPPLVGLVPQPETDTPSVSKGALGKSYVATVNCRYRCSAAAACSASPSGHTCDTANGIDICSTDGECAFLGVDGCLSGFCGYRADEQKCRCDGVVPIDCRCTAIPGKIGTCDMELGCRYGTDDLHDLSWCSSGEDRFPCCDQFSGQCTSKTEDLLNCPHLTGGVPMDDLGENCEDDCELSMWFCCSGPDETPQNQCVLHAKTNSEACLNGQEYGSDDTCGRACKKCRPHTKTNTPSCAPGCASIPETCPDCGGCNFTVHSDSSVSTTDLITMCINYLNGSVSEDEVAADGFSRGYEMPGSLFHQPGPLSDSELPCDAGCCSVWSSMYFSVTGMSFIPPASPSMSTEIHVWGLYMKERFCDECPWSPLTE